MLELLEVEVMCWGIEFFVVGCCVECVDVCIVMLCWFVLVGFVE